SPIDAARPSINRSRKAEKTPSTDAPPTAEPSDPAASTAVVISPPETLAHVWYQAVPYYTNLRYTVVPGNRLGVIQDVSHRSDRRYESPDDSRQDAARRAPAEAGSGSASVGLPPLVLAKRGEELRPRLRDQRPVLRPQRGRLRSCSAAAGVPREHRRLDERAAQPQQD